MNKRHLFYVGIVLLAAVMLLGAPLMALAHVDVTIRDASGGQVSSTTPYSTKMTCGGCHFKCSDSTYSADQATWCDGSSGKEQKSCLTPGNCPDYASYASADTSHSQGYPNSSGLVTFTTYTITSPSHGASVGYHSQHGRNEELTSAQRTIWGAPAFIGGSGMFGRYCMPSNRQLVRKDLDTTNAKKELEMGVSNWAKSCGVCHAGGGQMEYDRDMNPYSATSAAGDRYTYLVPTVDGSKNAVAGRIVDIAAEPAIQSTHLYGDNKAEVDCLMCHMSATKPGAAYYKYTLKGSDLPRSAGGGALSGGVDNPELNFTVGAMYDSYNRNIAVSYGYLKQAASAGIGAGIDLSTGAVSGMTTTVLGASISGTPKGGNCAQCHARNEQDSIGLPNMSMAEGGMVAGYGNFIRITDPGQAFDWDKISADGTCSGDCSNDTKWFEFGCKTGMGKRSHKTGVGTADRFANGFCLICTMYSKWTDANPGYCLPSVLDACATSSGISADTLKTNPYALIDMSVGAPMKVPGKMPDTDVHDASSQGMSCASCHYTVTGTSAARTVSGNGSTYTYASQNFEKMDHQFAKGYSMLEKAGDGFEGTVSCASCHTTRDHPKLKENGGTLVSPTPKHAGFPALHLEKIDCRTCHIPAIYAKPGRLLFRDWTAGGYRQTEGSNGNANHFQFAWSLAEGSMSPIRLTPMWITTPEGTKITPMQIEFLPIWAGSVQKASDLSVMWSPAKTRDITASAAVVSAKNPGFGIRINGTSDFPGFEGFNLADPLKINSKSKIDAMAQELKTPTPAAGAVAEHSGVRDARINLYPLFYDTSHGVVDKEFALGSPAKGGCIMCHSSSAANPMTGQPMDKSTYSPNSVGFFDGNDEMLQNGFQIMAQYDCDNPYIFNMMTTGNPYAGNTPTCDVLYTNDPMWGGDGACNGTQPGINPNTGTANGTLGICKQQIGGKLAQSMGLPADPMMAMDGVQFMQVMAIREGQVAAGCNPMMSMFGLPSGCAADGHQFYSRDEIRKYFAHAMEQSFFTPTVSGNWTNPVTGAIEAVPSTLGRVFGVSTQITKNPLVGTGANKFDFGATCRNPLDGSTFPCSEAMPGMTNLINTSLSHKTTLGYTDAQLSTLMSLFAAPAANAPVAGFSYKTTELSVAFDASSSQNAVSYTWDFGDGATGSGATITHPYAAVGLYKVKLTVTNADGATNSKLTALSVVKANHDPVASGTYTVSGNTVIVTDTSTDSDGDTLAILVNWGDGTASKKKIGYLLTHNYDYGTYTIRIGANDGMGGNSIAVVVADLNIANTTLGSISGVVTDSTGTAINAAQVTLYSGATAVKQTGTGSTGLYLLGDVPAGTYTVKVVKADYLFSDATNVVVSAGANTPLNIQAQAKHSIYGNITNAPAGVLVQLLLTSNPAVVVQQTTTYGTSGAYWFVNIPDGDYTVAPQPVLPATVSPATVDITVSGADVTVSTVITYTP